MHNFISLPLSATIAELAKALHPGAFTATTFKEVRAAWATAVREHGFSVSSRMTSHAVAKRQQAMAHCVERLHDRAAAMYFVEGGWHEKAQALDPKTTGHWYFLAMNVSANGDARSFKTVRDASYPLQISSCSSHLALWVPSPETVVRVSCRSFLAKYGTPDYEGPASGLIAWGAMKLIVGFSAAVVSPTAH